MAKIKCRNCGSKIISYPVWEGQEQGEPFSFNKINWYNLLIGDWTKLMFFVMIIFVAVSYGHDSKAYRDIYSNPCDYVLKNIDVCNERPEQGNRLIIGDNLSIVPWVNITLKEIT